jgi:N-acetylglucosamine-6-sulfatase
VQAVDKMIGTLQQTLEKTGVADRTVVVFTSDNGYHMGEYRLNPGKMTAFDTDVHVPLVITGPGVTAGRTVSQPAENIDLRPTFDTLAGVTPTSDVDGHTLTPLLSGNPSDWRDAALIEHHGPDIDPTDPDHPAKNSGNPTTYSAVRTTDFTYVEYTDGEREYYDRRSDPAELQNTAATLSADQKTNLHKTLTALTACHGSAACWSAAHLS